MADLASRIAALSTRIGQEIKAVRTEMAGIGGGAIPSGSATVTAGGFDLRQTVTASGVTPSSKILLTIAPHGDADENDPEMLDIVSMSAVPSTDAFDAVLVFSTYTSGPVKINYMVV